MMTCDFAENFVTFTQEGHRSWNRFPQEGHRNILANTEQFYAMLENIRKFLPILDNILTFLRIKLQLRTMRAEIAT